MGRGKTKPSTKRNKTNEAKKQFNSWLKTGEPVVLDKNQKNEDGTLKPYVIQQDEKFLRACKPYPQYWFVSNYGTIISFKNLNNPIVLTLQNKKSADGKRPHVQCRPSGSGGKQKTVPTYVIVADTFQAYVYGKAKRKKGTQWHHTVKYTECKNYKELNDPRYLERVTSDVHNYLTRLQEKPRDERTEREKTELLVMLQTIVKLHSPDKINIVIDNGAKMTAIYDDVETRFIFSEPFKKDTEFEKAAGDIGSQRYVLVYDEKIPEFEYPVSMAVLDIGNGTYNTETRIYKMKVLKSTSNKFRASTKWIDAPNPKERASNPDNLMPVTIVHPSEKVSLKSE